MLIDKKTVYLALVAAMMALPIGSMSVRAGDIQAQSSAIVLVALVMPGNKKAAGQSSIIPAHDSWKFVDCVESSEDCSEHAHENGYNHHRVVRDHHTCEDEPHLACYGR